MTQAAQLDSAPSTAGCREAVLEAFQRKIAPVTTHPGYRLGILLVAVIMVLLPLIYIALIWLVAYGVYFHAVYSTGLLQAGQGRVRLMAWLVYAAPMAIGAILVLFMMKPLFSRPARRPQRCSLAPDQEPLLFAFVAKVCESVGAPGPKRIDADCAVNASASFRHGVWSMFGNDLVLTIGMPLVAGLNSRQFAGVLAHEFGHFTQGVGMRLSYLIRSISHWFTRVVYERDEWDQKLIESSESVDIRLGWVLLAARFFVWLTRRILWVLMITGHVAAGYLLRQMEFDADRHETRLAGSETFEATVRRLAVLQCANQNAITDLQAFHREGRLADNLPQLILADSDFSLEVLAKINQIVDQSKTGWFDTHPSDAERIACAHREKTDGVFRLEEPAKVLFLDFDRLARETTLAYYQDAFEKTDIGEELVPVQKLLQRQEQEGESYKALNRCLQGMFSALRPFRLPRHALEPPVEPEQALARVRVLREELKQELPRYRDAYQSFDEADTRLLEAEQASALHRGGLKVAKSDFAVALTSVGQLQASREAHVQKQKAADPALAAVENLAAERLLRDLDLLWAPTVAEKIPARQVLQEECTVLLRTFGVLDQQVDRCLEVRNMVAALGMLFQRFPGHEREEKMIEAIRKWTSMIANRVRDIRSALMATPYPFEHARTGIAIGEYLLPNLPDEGNPGSVGQAGDSLIRSFTELRARTLGRLCRMAEIVEAELGLEPLPEPAAAKEGQAAASPPQTDGTTQ
jgi:hypothetical protein